MLKLLSDAGKYPMRINIALLLLRLSGGGFMLTHGYPKLIKLISGNPITFADPLGIGIAASLTLAVFAEVFCAVFLMVGLFTRLSTVALCTTMLVAGFVAHAGDGFKKQELALVYAFLYLTILIAGAGRYSLDHLLRKRKGI